MNIRRTRRQVDLMRLPLDGFDMFLITRLDVGAATFAELSDIAPCSPAETLRRLEHLEQLGVLELSGDRPRLLTTPAHAASTQPPEFGEDFVTLRPPALVAGDDDEMVTLRPPKPVSPEQLLQAAPRLSVSGVIQRAQVGIEFRTTQATVRNDGAVEPSVFSRATVIDEDGEERAKRTKEMG